MHWGQKLMAGMALFILFIGGMAFYMFSHHADTLVEDDYYEKGLEYDKEYVMKQNALDTAARPLITISDKAVAVTFKQRSDYKLVFKRLSDRTMDKQLSGAAESRQMVLVPMTAKDKGLWVVNVTWSSGGKSYLFEQEIFVHEP